MNEALVIELQPGEPLLWLKPGHSQRVRVVFERAADDGRIVVTLPSGKLRSVNVRNCRRADARAA